ncbi:GTP-binding protein, partial [Sporosarcina koreensis]|uniref:GTP-binding protein n=1 Tax=Sporosarcina koreensis TaxID=334735 RepID=UPI0005904CE6
MQQSKIPVYILSGFLGSGKTTLLMRMLAHCKETGKEAAIIMNELGKENVEGHLFETGTMYELLEGCICCTIQDDLRETLEEVSARSADSPVDVLFIEGTGAANPIDIQEVLYSEPYVSTYELMSVITVADAAQFLEYQSLFASTGEVRRLIADQLACCSLLLLTKTDLVSASI